MSLAQLMGYLKHVLYFSVYPILLFYILNEVDKDLDPDLVKPVQVIIFIGTLFRLIISVVYALPDQIQQNRIEERVKLR
jgi:hypothetical protein